VCDDWHTYENFLEYMGEAPEGHSIERKENDGNYEPGNCKWIRLEHQPRNKRNSIRIKETSTGQVKCLKQWCQKKGVEYATARFRFYKKLPIDLVLSKKRLTIDSVLFYSERLPQYELV
jgi:IS1 family transposase